MQHVSYTAGVVIAVCRVSGRIILSLCFPMTLYRFQIAAQYSRFGRTTVYADALVALLLTRRFLRRKPSMVFAFLTV